MREGAECFGGRDFERGKEIGEGVLGGFVPKQREREGWGGGGWHVVAKNGRGGRYDTEGEGGPAQGVRRRDMIGPGHGRHVR
jgi:hypothetical protein